METSRLRTGFARPRSDVLSRSLFVMLAVLVTMLTLTGFAHGATLPPDTGNIPGGSLQLIQLSLSPVITSGLAQPVFLTHARDNRLFIVERAGVIRIYQNGSLLSQPFLDINSLVGDTGSEEGLLGLAFPPNFSPSHAQFYVYYVNNSGDIVLARYNVSAGNPNVANPASAEIVLTIPHPGQTNHNGGQLAFGQDGYLYLAPGDGGGGGDPGENAQDPAELLGKVLRIDVETGDPATYTIPASNPFRQTPGFRPEIWALGVRNPYRFSFDRASGDLFIADVGQGNIEEINYEPNSDPGGRNYGWDCYEGSNPFESTGCGPASNYTFPVWQYDHTLGCSVTGGYVYRGQLFPGLSGIYFYGDYCSGRIWGLSFNGSSWQNTQYIDSSLSISSFGEDVNGEIYVVDLDGGVYRLQEVGGTPSATPTRTFTPTRTPTGVVTLSPTRTRTPTSGPKVTSTRTPTPIVTVTSTRTQPAGPTPTRTRTPTRTPKR
jgi:glucose/arabinose dehydrogenase